MGGSIFLTLFFGVFLAVGFGLMGFGFHSMNMAKRAEHWPTTSGRIVWSDFDIDSDSDGTTYRTKVKYEYNADGRNLVGEKIAFGYAGSSSEQYHRDIYRALGLNRSLAVRYNPANPEQAVLSFGVNNSIRTILIFGIVWTTFTCGLIILFWLGSRRATTILDNMILY